MLRLEPIADSDDAALIGWVPDAAALRMFAGETLSWPLDRAQLDAIRADERLVAWTGRAGELPGRAVAHGELVPIDDERILIARLIVAPAERGLGLGRALVEGLVSEAARRGASRVELNVYRDNDAAIALYRATGFRHFGLLSPSDGALRLARNL